MFEVKAVRISLIYFSESSNNTYNIWNEVKFVSYLQAKLYARLNVTFDLSEKCFIKLSILKTYYEQIYFICVI